MSSFTTVPNTLNVIGVTSTVAVTRPTQFRASEYYDQLNGPLLTTACTWQQVGSTMVTPTGFYLAGLPTSSTCQVAQLLNQDPVTWISVVGANGASYRLAPNGGCLCLTSSGVAIAGPNGTSTWQVLAVTNNGSVAAVNAQLDFFFAGF